MTSGPSISSQVDWGRVRAVLFDVDGTLYDQQGLRTAMLLRLSRACLLRPITGMQTLKILKAYRSAQEEMRWQDRDYSDLSSAQIELASKSTGRPADEVRKCVMHWMEKSPLDLLLRYRRQGLVEFLNELRQRNVLVAACSDYPARDKLTALGIDSYFDVVNTAQDEEVGRFKPHPRLLETTLRRLRVSNQEAIVIGDRPEVDGAAASRAGLECLIVTRTFGEMLEALRGGRKNE